MVLDPGFGVTLESVAEGTFGGYEGKNYKIEFDENKSIGSWDFP